MKTMCKSLYSLLLGAAVAFPALAQDAGQTNPPAETQPEVKPKRRITYNAPDRGAPVTRTGGGTRGQGLSKVSIEVIAPQQTGLTSREQPTVLYFLSAPTDRPIVFTVTDTRSRETIVEHTEKGPKAAGIHALDLKALNAKLEPGKEYKVVAVVEEVEGDDSQNATSAAKLKRVGPEAAPKDVQGADKVAQAVAYAEKGLWYDAQASLNEAIRANPADKSLREMRSELLAAENLKAVAEFEKNAAK